MTDSRAFFPPFPSGLKGRHRELATLARIAAPNRAAKLALVGTGGSGKSMLACALGHRLVKDFPGGLHWFRSGPWDARTLGEMLAIRFGTSRVRAAIVPALRRHFASRAPTFVVLDNHENDHAICRFLNELRGAPVTWVITARRCLLGGVYLFPVVAPLNAAGETAFSRVRPLANLLRHNPLALDVADSIVRSEAIGVPALRSWLLEEGIEDVRVIDHEDDLPEVALLLDWAWRRLTAVERRLLTILAHTGGDHMDSTSLLTLANARERGDPNQGDALERLRAWHLVLVPLPRRYALHAVVRYAVLKRTELDPRRMLAYYLDMLERDPGRLDLEQTHLYAAMDYAHTESKLDWMLRIERLLARFDEA
jgi:hypothetical protein